MPIQSYQSRDRVKASVPPEDVDSEVLEIMASLGTDYRAFTHASQMYNSTFFEGESIEFKIQLCTALKAHFSEFPNSFWDKALKL